MEDFQAIFEVYSPRWGHADRYQVTFTQEQMRIGQGVNAAICRQLPDHDPVWSGYGNGLSDNSLMRMFSNDQIYAPKIVPFALEWAWKQWRDNGCAEEEILAGLQELFTWIDQTARSKPKGKFWQTAF